MGQPELSTFVTGLKTDIKQGNKLDRKTVADRSNMANMSALDFLLEMADAKKEASSSIENARDMFHLADELHEITEFFDNSGAYSAR
jgi:hypothetical protein